MVKVELRLSALLILHSVGGNIFGQLGYREKKQSHNWGELD